MFETTEIIQPRSRKWRYVYTYLPGKIVPDTAASATIARKDNVDYV